MIKKSVIKYFSIISLITVNLQFAGCSSSSSPQTVINNKSIYLIKPKTTIFTVLPKITYERIDTGKKISVIENDTTDLGEWISRISKEEIQSKGLLISKNIKDENKNQIDLVIEGLKLKEISDQLVRPSPMDRYLNMMDSICNNNEISAVLLQYLRVKVGDDAEWVGIPLIAGKPKVRQSSSFLKSVIRECGTGNILWKNECFIRKLPISENKTFEDTIRTHFLNLTILGGPNNEK